MSSVTVNERSTAFPQCGLGVDVRGKCMHSMPRKDLDWEGNFVASLWEMKSSLFPFLMTRLLRPHLSLPLQQKEKWEQGPRRLFMPRSAVSSLSMCQHRVWKGGYLWLCRLHRHKLPSPLSGNTDCKMRVLTTLLALQNWHVCEGYAGALQGQRWGWLTSQ